MSAICYEEFNIKDARYDAECADELDGECADGECADG